MMLFSRQVAFLVAAVFIAGACISAHAEEVDSKGKKQALIRLLIRAGRTDEAAAAMRSLYPKGPPASGQAALDYYDVVGNTESGWEGAKEGLEKLAKASPNDPNCQLMLAKHLSRHAETRRRSLEMFASLANRGGIDKRLVLGEWRNALDKLDYNSASIALYKQYLAVDPDNSSVRDSLASVQRAEARKLPWQLRDKADAQLAAGHPDEAIATLKHALQLDPKNAWARFDLARLYHKRGEAKQGRELMEAGLSAAPGDADMLYANALYVSLLDEADNALRLLDRIPPRDRSAAIKRLRKKMEIKKRTQQAQALARDGKLTEMRETMGRAQTDAGKDAELVNIVANAWIDLNDPERGVELMKHLAAQRSPPKHTLLYYAKLLNRTERNDELDAVLSKLDAARGWTASDRDDLRYLHASLAVHRADQLRHEGKIKEAFSVLVPAVERSPENTDMLMALARVDLAAGEPEQAREIYQRVLQLTPGNEGARRALNRMTEDEAGKRAREQRNVAEERQTVAMAAPSDEIGSRLAVAKGYRVMGDTDTAGSIIDQLRKAAPDDPRVLIEAGHLAKLQRNYGDALDDFERAHAEEEVAEIKRGRAEGYVATGVDYVSKTGSTPGISNLAVTEVPVEMRIPLGYSGGRAFVQVDPVVANAGTLDPADLYNLRQYGKVLALAPNGIPSASAQRARGSSIALGYEGDGLRADVGTAPVGFPVAGVLGGVKWSHYTEDSGFSFDVSRRPMTSSVLSYAGASDPVSGEVWGGVRITGMSMHLSHDFGRLSPFIEPGYFVLTGVNVLRNTEAALRTGVNWSFIDAGDMRLTAGLALTYWHFRENLRFYSFGHGGYYSPQKYHSLAIPVRWAGREEHWSFLVQGSVSAAVSYEKDMPFYPTDPALQAQAVANSGLAAATYTGGPGHGTGYSLGGTLEYQFTQKLFGGARLQVDRSAYYTPNFAIVYLRYMFDGQTSTVAYPPDPVKAYSRY